MSTARACLLVVLSLVMAISINYLFAIAGEPRAHWLFCTILDLCE